MPTDKKGLDNIREEENESFDEKNKRKQTGKTETRSISRTSSSRNPVPPSRMFRHKTFFFFILHVLIPSSSSSVVGKPCQPRLCGNLTVKHPFALERNCSSSSPSHDLVCHDQNLYLVLPGKGIFHVSAIDYDAESLRLGKNPLKLGIPEKGVWEMKFREVLSFTVPTHLPNVCEECTKPHGNCGIGLRCICYPKKCKTQIFSGSARNNPVEAGFAVAFLMATMALFPMLLF